MTVNESVWMGLLAIWLTSIAVMPIISGFILVIMGTMDLPKERNDAIWLGFIILPFSLIFAWLMFFCVPTYFWWEGMFTEGGGYWGLILPSLILTCIAAAGPLACLYLLLFGKI